MKTSEFFDCDRGYRRMKLFKCQACGQLVYFENRVCERCSHLLGYLPQSATISALEAEGETWRALAFPECVYRFCANANSTSATGWFHMIRRSRFVWHAGTITRFPTLRRV